VKLKLLILLSIFSFAVSGFCLDKPTKTYYNNKVPYKALFQSHNTNQIKVQVRTKRGKVQAEIPVVNDSKKDVTQESE
jgi:hypothetical protein